ncbi:hypothetical protein [Streptomyces sp. NPDC003710]
MKLLDQDPNFFESEYGAQVGVGVVVLGPDRRQGVRGCLHGRGKVGRGKSFAGGARGQGMQADPSGAERLLGPEHPDTLSARQPAAMTDSSWTQA